MLPLVDEKEVKLTTRRGEIRTYFISEIPAIPSRQIAALWLPNALPKIGDYAVNEKMCFEMMKYVEVVAKDGSRIRLVTEDLVNNHCDFKTLAGLEKEMVDHNYGFFLHGTISNFFGDIMQKVPVWISKISTDSLAQLSTKVRPPSTN